MKMLKNWTATFDRKDKEHATINVKMKFVKDCNPSRLFEFLNGITEMKDEDAKPRG